MRVASSDGLSPAKTDGGSGSKAKADGSSGDGRAPPSQAAAFDEYKAGEGNETALALKALAVPRPLAVPTRAV